MLLYGDSDVAAAATDAISSLLQGANSEDYVWLDEEVREVLNWNFPTVLRSAWSPPPQVKKSTDAQITEFGIGTYHPNGRIRQQAVVALGELDSPRALPFLLIRLNDWVDQVRAAAQLAGLRHLERGDFDGFGQHVSLVMRLLHCSRDLHEEFVDKVMDALWRSDPSSLLCSLLFHAVRDVRHDGYRQLMALSGVDKGRIILSAFCAEDPVLRLWAVRDAVTHLQQADLTKLLACARQDHFAPVRREALAGYLAKSPDKALAELRLALLDRSAAVRDCARFHLRKDGQTDFADFYRRVIEDNGPLEAALAGLSETGSQADVAILRRFAKVRSCRLRESAVRGIGRLSGDDGSQDLLVALQDDSRRVSRIAKQALIENTRDVTLRELELIANTNPDSHVRRATTEIIDHIGSWSAIPLLLALSIDADDTIAAAARTSSCAESTAFLRRRTQRS